MTHIQPSSSDSVESTNTTCSLVQDATVSFVLYVPFAPHTGLLCSRYTVIERKNRNEN